MAPSRRKGGGKAAAAAAARRQWKVGDLVLAKVKGFPAWPATVSEPEKWGYSADWKKVLVYFFGTQQIAFCNPADVEAFTEEKKQSLLIKRQGRGADFVRAVQEIIDSYEKSKKQDQVDSNSGDDVTLADGGNSADSSAHFGLKDQTEASGSTLDLQSKPSNSPTVREAPNLPAEDAPIGGQLDHDKEALLDQPTDNLVVKETPVIATYTSRKRTGGLRSQSTQRKAPSARRSRTSARVESYRFQNFMMQFNVDGKNAGDMSANIIRDGSLRRNKRTRKSPDASECDDLDSSAFISNGSVEDNSSEIVTVESDALSLNEGSTVDSGSKVERSETVVECLDGDVELSKGLDFQIKAVVLKKKRKPNRKRVTNDFADPPATVDTEADLEVGMHNTSQNFQNTCGNLDERHSKEDGDEHLPLLKRARVRMGKPSSAEELKGSSFPEELKSSSSAEEIKSSSSAEEFKSSTSAEELKSSSSAQELKSSPSAEEFKSFSQAEEKCSKDVTANLLEQISSTANHNEVLADKEHSPAKGDSDNVSPVKNCTENSGNRPQLWRGTKNQSFVCSADGEAALPPSKRLHRALEAMSANAAEEGQACIDSSAMSTSIKGFCADSSRRCFHETMESRGGNDLGLQSLNSPGSGAVGIVSSSNPLVLDESAKSSGEAQICDQLIKSQKPESCEDVVGLVDDGDGKDHNGSSSILIVETVVQVQSAEHLLSNDDRRQASFRANQGSIDQILPLKDENNTENLQLSNFRAENVDKGLDTLDHTELSLDAVSGADKSSRISPCDGAETLQYTEEGTGCENAELLKSQIDDNCQTNSMFEVAEEVKHKEGQKGASSICISDDRLADNDVSGVQLCSSPVDGVDSPARGSPPNTSLCHISTSESANIVQNNSYCSPNGHLQQKKMAAAPVADEETKIDAPLTQRPKSVGKWSNYSEAHAALTSFEAVLGSLTRTKESIGRATRIAIDCARFGVSTKVMEILARSLESESNLHKRVDLFFLVDSITQCSRGLKGDVGGIYPPAIQAMLPRLLSAAAPPGSIAQENRRQCLKVLRLWLERRILPETVVRHHMRELDSLSCSSSAGAHSRRSARTERALDDPIRDMEGMLVDEYGSNSSFQLPGFCMPRMLKEEDEGSDSDGGSFEAVTPEHNSETPEERDATPAIEKHRHILEDVDGELEMEDVAPSCDIEMSSTNCVAGVNSSQTAHDQFLPFAPPLPQDVPPSSPPLPSSPPPPPPPPPPLPHPCAMADPYSNAGAMHNMQNDVRQSVTQQSVAPRINSTMPSDAVNYNAPECRDLQMPMQMSDSNSSFSSYRVCSSNNIQQTDGPRFHHKPYPPRPPHVPPSNQFSYVQAGQNVKSRRETPPPSHSHRFHPLPNFDGGNFYNNHDRMQPPRYEHRDSWRFPGPSFPGPRYPDEVKDSYASGSYVGPPCEPPRLPNQGWAHPPRSVNHRNSLPVRPPSGGAVPVGARGMWRPR